jgi:hypothetical protein
VDWLLRVALDKKGFFRRERLAPKSPEVLAALTGLASHWRADPRVEPVLQLALRSGDPEVFATLTAQPERRGARPTGDQRPVEPPGGGAKKIA